MLESAGFSIAMGNSHDKIKKYADYVTDDVDNDGLMKAIEQIIS
jgi:hydroxymethylpyrimidine pyrophosphatase-like HAD family hydrolase